MEIKTGNCEEKARLGFLLGSALRGGDTCQFFDVYDSIIPKNLDTKEVELIKNEARRVAELPERDFNELAGKAPCFSLAMSAGSGDHGEGRDCLYSNPVAASKLPDSVKQEAEVDVSACARKPGIDSLARTSRHFASSSKSENCDDDECDQSDSGVFNSSKNTVGSGSDGDLSDDGERVGLLHYVPPKKSNSRPSDQDLASDLSDLERQCQDLPSNRSMCNFTEKQNDIAYDAAFSVSSEENTSPRSQQECFPGDFLKAKEDFNAAAMEGTEMATIRDHSAGLTEEEVERQLAADYNAVEKQRHEQEYDEVHSCSSDELESVVVHQPSDSEDNGNSFNLHRKLYARPSYTDVDPELDELEESARSSKSCHSRLYYNNPKNRSGQSETDFLFTSVNTYGSTRRYNNSYTENRTSLNNKGSLELGSARRNVTEPNRTSERVHIEKTIKSRDCTKPPFGDPVRKDEIFNKTTERLIDPYKSSYNKRDIPNLPLADSLPRPDAEDKKEAEKKRKKKKKKSSGAKDDGGDSDARDTADQDVNGNPISLSSRPYSSKHTSTKLPNKPDTFPKHSRYPGSVCSFNGVGHGSPGQTGGEHDDMLSGLESKKQRRKAKKDKEQAGVIKADKIPGNRGQESVESLLDFIENTPTNKKKNKKSPPILGGTGTASHSINEKVNGKKKKRNLLMNNTYAKDEKGSDIDNDYEQGVKMNEVSEERKDGLSESSADSEPSKDALAISVLSTKLDLDEPINDTMALPAGLTVSSDSYIFTDFDKAPKPAKEEEFQVVGKRKKKLPPRDYNYMFTKDDSYWFKDDLKKKTKTLPRSMTPPPRPSQESSGERAFSPSAFPVLCTSRSREGRRNSTGNTVLEAGQDDSDLESVKSVPVAVDGLGLIKSGSDSPERVQEQSLAISYAKIAAAPRPKLAENTLTPTARRHSFGSGSQSATEIRESVDVNSSFPSLFNKDISGSSSDRVPDSNVTVSVISGKSSRSTDSDNSGFSSDSKLSTTGPEDSTDRSLSCDSSEGDQNISTKESQSNSIVVFESVSQSVVVSMPTDAPTSGKNASPSTAKPSPESDCSANRQASSGSRIVSSVSQSQTAPSTLTNKAGASKPPLPVRTSNNKRNNKTSKSVIFLDRKLNAPSRNLGISFGFDSELDVSVGLVDKLDPTTLSSCSGSSHINTSRPVRPVVKQSTPDKESNVLSPTKALQNEDRNKTKVDRTKGAVLPPNGIVIPSAQEGSNTLKSTVTQKALSSALNLTERKDNTLSFTSAPAENLTVKRVVDYQDNCGSFDVESAVGFLLNEWDKVMKLKERDPDQVMYYK